MTAATPELRFPEFKGNWKPARAGDAFRNSKAKGEAGLPIYSVTQDRGLVRRDSLDRHMGADAADGTNLRAQRGDLVYNMMRMWQGAVGLASEECMVSPAYVVLSPKKGISPEFFNYWFENQHMLHQLWAYSHGLTSDRLRLYYQDFAKIPLALPDLAEQEKIATVLDATSRKIALLTDKKAALDEYKRGLVQRLFSRELRFTRDDGSAFPDWEERRLGDIGSLYSGLTGKTSADFGQGQPYVTYRQVFESARLNVDAFEYVEVGKDERQSRVRLGDVLVTTSSETPQEVGFSSVVIDPVGEVYLNSFCFGFRPNDLRDLLPEFSRQLFRAPQYRCAVEKLAQGSTRYNISRTGFLKLSLHVPHPDEQRKIAAALSALDAKVDALSQKITEMEAFKKGLLQKLFV